MKGRDEIKMKVKIINETLDDDYSSSDFETKRGIDTTENIFYVGQRFSSLDELERIKSKYEDDNFCELWKKDVRTLAAARKRVPKRIAIANPSLYYYSLLLSCKFGSEPKKRKIRVRKTKSFRQGCPFEVYLALALDGQALGVYAHNRRAQSSIVERTLRPSTETKSFVRRMQKWSFEHNGV